MQRWICLRLSELAAQCQPRQTTEDGVAALAVVERQRIHTVNAAAALLGVEVGMEPARARALANDQPLQLLARDKAAEESAMDALCCWAYGITPHLYRFRDECLMLEVSGSLRLFGGERAILQKCTQGVACRGYSAEVGIADTPLAAWAFSHSDAAEGAGSNMGESAERDPGEGPGRDSGTGAGKEGHSTSLRESLNALPLTILEPLHEQFIALQRSGLQRLGEVLALPPASLSRRCGTPFSELLQTLTGEIQLPVVHFEPPSCYLDRYPLGYPVRNQDELGPGLEQLLLSLESYLRQRQLQTRQLLWEFSGLHGYRETLEIRASEAGPTRQDWYRLTRLRLERQPFSDDVELIQLRVSELEDASPPTGSLFRQSGQNQTPAQLVDLLSNRLGSQAVSSLRCRDGHLPEQCSQTSAPGARPDAQDLPGAQRPFWLLPEPEPMGTERDTLRFWGKQLTLIHGPERIEDGWWDQATSRDYFVARNDLGQLFWVFHERRKRSWFMHGLFA